MIRILICTAAFTYLVWWALPEVIECSENLKSSDLKTEVECDHMVYVNEGKPVLMHASLRVSFCPKCGEKL